MTELRTTLLIILGLAIGFGAGEFHGRSYVYEQFVTSGSIAAQELAMRLE
jgi:hypothetical protein